MRVLRAGDPVTARLAAQRLHNGQRINQRIVLLKSLRGVTFKRIENGHRGIGVIAQELATVVPEAVQADDDGLLSVAYGNLVGVLIEAVKELAGKVERLGGGNEILDLT